MSKKDHSETFAEIVSEVSQTPPRQVTSWSSGPIGEREWFDDAEHRWHMRGGPLDAKRLRSILKDPELSVAHFYWGRETTLTGAARDDLVARVLAFIEDETSLGGGGFDLAEFRDDDGKRLLVVEESC